MSAPALELGWIGSVEWRFMLASLNTPRATWERLAHLHAAARWRHRLHIARARARRGEHPHGHDRMRLL